MWKTKNTQEITRKKKAGEDVSVKVHENKKRGCPLLLGCELDRQVQAYVPHSTYVRMVLSSILRLVLKV